MLPRLINYSNNRFAYHVAFFYHPFLGDEDLWRGYLHSEVSSGHHDAVCLIQNIVKVVQALLIFYFSYNLYVSTFGSQ